MKCIAFKKNKDKSENKNKMDRGKIKMKIKMHKDGKSNKKANKMYKMNINIEYKCIKK
jgi:hypothetical protein